MSCKLYMYGQEFDSEKEVLDYMNKMYGLKTGVSQLFEAHPELSDIGSTREYSAYLDSIFPESVVKDIVYHGTMKDLVPKDGKFKGYVTYFTDSIKYARTFGVPVNRQVVPAIINVKSPFNSKSELADVPEEVHLTDKFTNPRIVKSNSTGYDSVVGIDAGQKEGRTIAVFEPEQIHVLGSKKDLDGFRAWKEQNQSAPNTSFKGFAGEFEDSMFEEEQEEQEVEEEDDTPTAGARAFKKSVLTGSFVDPFIINIDTQITALKNAISQTPNRVRRDELNRQINQLVIQKRSLMERQSWKTLYSVMASEMKMMEYDLINPNVSLRQLLDNMTFLSAWINFPQLIGEEEVDDEYKEAFDSGIGKARNLFNRISKRLHSQTKEELVGLKINPKYAEDLDKAVKDITSNQNNFYTISFDSRAASYIGDTLVQDSSYELARESQDFQKALKNASAKIGNDASFMMELDPTTNTKTLIKPHKKELYEKIAELKEQIREAEDERASMYAEYTEITAQIKKAQSTGQGKLASSLMARRTAIKKQIDDHKKNGYTWETYRDFLRENFDFTPKESMEAAIAQYEQMREEGLRIEMAGIAEDSVDRLQVLTRFEAKMKQNDPREFKKWIDGESGARWSRAVQFFDMAPKAKWRTDKFNSFTSEQKEFYDFFMDWYLKTYASLAKYQDPDPFMVDKLMMEFVTMSEDTRTAFQKVGSNTVDWLKGLVMVGSNEDIIDFSRKGPLSGREYDRLRFKSVRSFTQEATGYFKEGEPLPIELQGKLKKGRVKYLNGILVRSRDEKPIPKFVRNESDPIKILEKFVLFGIDYRLKNSIEGIFMSVIEIAAAAGTIKETDGDEIKFDLYDNIKVQHANNLMVDRLKYSMDAYVYGKKKEAYKASSKLAPGEKGFSWGRTLDTVTDLTRARGMALNPFSGLGNLSMGTINNYIFAAGKQFFTEADLGKAYWMMRGSTLNFFDKNTLNNYDSKKLAKIMRRWQVLGDVSDSIFADKNAISKVLDELYVFQRRGEFLNQGAVILATMLHTKTKDKNGVERSLWDLIDLDEENDTLDINKDFEGTEYADSKRLDRFFTGAIKLNRKIHGDYDPKIPMQFKKTAIGRALALFRTWLPQAIRERFGAREQDIQLSEAFGKNVEFEGRWVTIKRLIWDENDGSPAAAAKEIFKLFMGAVANTFTNKKVVTLDHEMSDLDKANVAMVIKEVWYALLLAASTAVLKVLVSGDDDDEEAEKKKASILYTLYNQTSRVESELWFLYSVTDMKKFVKDIVPMVNTIEQALKVKNAAIRLVMSPEDDIYKSGFRKGTSKFWKEVQMFAPITKQGQNVWSTSSQIFDDDPYK